MKRLALSCLFILTAAVVAPATVAAQTVNFTASHISVGGTPLASGTLCVQPVDNANHPIIATLGGASGGALVTEASCTTVTSGVLASGFQVPDTAISGPRNVCLRLTITDTNLNGRNVYTAPCVQPASSGQAWCTTSGGATSCNFDSYVPNSAPQAIVQTGPPGPQGPAGPAGPQGPQGTRYPNATAGLTGNSSFVPANDYGQSVSTGAANFGPSAGQTSRNWITFGHLYRIRQNGTITRVKVNVPVLTGITGFYVSVCRTSTAGDTTPASVDTIATSSNLVSSLSAGVNTLTLSPGLSAQWGDYICGRVEWSGGATAQNLYTPTATSATGETATVWYVDNTSPSASAYNWTAQSSLTGKIMLVEADMTAPVIACTGDSIDSGAQDTYSFSDTYAITTVANTAYCDVLGQTLGVTTQNFGHAGWTAAQIGSAFASGPGAVAPKYVVLEGGTNDILFSSLSDAALEAEWTTLLNSVQSLGAVPIITTVLPFMATGYTNAMSTQRDHLNAWLATQAAAYGGLYVNLDPYIGTYYPGGPAGNLWAMNPSYAGPDLLHPNTRGKLRMAQAIADALAGTNSQPSIPAQLPGFGPFYVTIATGSANTYAVSITALQPLNTLTEGMTLLLGIAATNTGASTLAVNGGTAHPIVISSTSFPFVGGEFVAGQNYLLRYTTSGAGYWAVLSRLGSTMEAINGVNIITPDALARMNFTVNGATNFYGGNGSSNSFTFNQGTSPYTNFATVGYSGSWTFNSWIWAKLGYYGGSGQALLLPSGLTGFTGSTSGKVVGATTMSAVAGTPVCTDSSSGVTTSGCQAGVNTLSSASGTTASRTFTTAFGATPNCTVTPTSNAGAFYISAQSATAITITYATSGAQSFNVHCFGSGGVW